jgi:GNAT superfamily N-acetyltransferase
MSSPEISFVVSDLRDRPEFAKAVADRVWQVWWQGKEYPLDYIEGRVAENLDGSAVPFAVVAHEDGQFLGTASVIPSDLGERPEYTPWVAAVWVDPEHRQRGVGQPWSRSQHRVHSRPGLIWFISALCQKNGPSMSAWDGNTLKRVSGGMV